MSRTLILDGDVLIYKAAEAHEFNAQFDDWLWVRFGNIEGAMSQFDDLVQHLEHKLHCNHTIVCLSDNKNWRKRLLPTYKFNRKTTPKPVLFQEMRSRIVMDYHFKLYPYLEADDVCGILATSPEYEGERVTCSIDKDFYGIPGAYYNIDKDEETFATVEDANRFHMRQTLVGDAVDGFAGCPTIGPVRAQRLLDKTEPEGWWFAVTEAYIKQGLTPERALIVARIARTLRYDEYNPLTSEITLWSPPQEKSAVLSVV